MQTRTKRLLIILAVVAAIYAITFAIDVSNQEVGSDADAQLAVAPIVKKVMVMDIDEQGQINENGILAGTDPVLAMQVLKDPNDPNSKALLYLDDFNALGKLDSNRDGRIEATDPVYSKMVLVFFNEAGQVTKMVSLADAGIRAILWQKKIHVPHSLDRITSKLFKEQRKVLMSDNSTRRLGLIHVKDTLLQGV